jgi:ABC-type sugar transport system substrate-binding protein
MTTHLIHEPRARRGWIGPSAVAIAAMVAMAGCSSGTKTASTATTSAGSGSATTAASAASSCVADANAYLKDYQQLPTALPASFTPLSKAPKSGGTVIKIVNGGIPSDGHSADEQAVAAQAIGWTAKKIVFNGTVEDLNAKWEQAIAEKPTAITGSGFPAAALQKPIADAKAAGIIAALSSVTDTAISNPGLGAVSNSTAVSKNMGDLHANLVMRDSGCKAHVAIFNLPFPILKVATDEFQSVLTAKCPDCKVSYNEIQAKDIGSPTATNAIVSALQADPSIKYAYTIIGNVADGLVSALSAANISGIKIFGEVPDAAAIKALQDGTHAWWVTQDSTINGWMELDSILRVLDTGQPVTTTGNPLGVLTPQNVPKGTSTVPTYPTNYRELWKKLWLVG